jgi:excisionase family DNA binding protein
MTPVPAHKTEAEPKLLTVAEVAKRLRFSDETIHRKARQGELPYVDVLGTKRFRREVIEAIERGDAPVSGAA